MINGWVHVSEQVEIVGRAREGSILGWMFAV